MHFLSTDYWQQDRYRNESGLLLQQYVCEGVCIHFSCVCRGQDGDRAGGYMTEQLLRWFREISLKRLTRKPEKALEEAQAGLRKVILRTDDELADAVLVGDRTAGTGCARADFAGNGFAGIGFTGTGATALAGVFCVGEDFFYFCRGGQRLYFINTGFGHAHIRRLGAEGGSLFFQRGILQPDIGLLFAVDSFWEHVSEKMIKEGLFVREVVTEEQMRRHLNELGEEAQRRGGKDMAAVFVRTVRQIEG